ncbi:hypothetical protein HRbin36_00823 [bacterium HR36]|nr:hypothetical protein HRbin36_00823 [bacterium HR36]
MALVALSRKTSTVQASEARKPTDRSSDVRAVLLIALWTAILSFYGLDAGFLYRTEALRALVARNMLYNGDYWVPMLYGEPLLTKGPVMYAAIAVASWPFGEVTTWSARIPAALAMVLTALVMFWHLRHYVEDGAAIGRQGGIVGARVGLTSRGALIVSCMLACNPLWLDKATSAEIDMVVVFWVTLALVCFFRAVDADDSTLPRPELRACDSSAHSDKTTADGCFGSEQRLSRIRSAFWWLIALVAMALGTLTKWHAPVFFYATAISYLWWRQRLRLLLRVGHVLGVIAAAGIVGSWGLVVCQRVGAEVLWTTLWQQALPRLSPSHQHGERLWLEVPMHPVKMLVCGLPWAVFVPVTWWRRWYRHLTPSAQALMQTLHCWTWPSLAIFTLLPDHDSRHSMPLLTGLIVCGALGCWLSLLPGMDASVRRLAHWGLVLVWGVFSLAAVFSVPIGWWRLPAERWPIALVLGSVAMLVLLAGWCAARRRQRLGMVASVLVLWLVIKVAFVELVVPVRSARDPIGKAALLKQYLPPSETLYIFQAKDEGIMFYYGGAVLRVRGWERLPEREHVYCLATPHDFDSLRRCQRWRIVWQRPFLDEQGDPMMLVLLQKG